MKPDWQSDDGAIQLYRADCRDVLPHVKADCVVTDPPYGLGFMGKGWDHGIPGPEFWSLALDACKPGAHLLAFGGTRTFHRLTCAIEDAGWEIRDCIGWIYGQGFPKSLNIGCKCGGPMVQYPHEENKSRAEPKTERDLRPVRDSDVSSPKPTTQKCREVLFEGVSKQGVPPTRRTKPSAAKVRKEQSCMEGGSDVLAKARQLQTDQVCSVPGGVSSNGAEGRVYHGASVIDGAEDGATAGAGGSGTPQEPRPTGQPIAEPRTLSNQRRTQEGGGVCPKCGGLLNRVGWGTALKPAWEPIIVARKPLDGTVAQNVLHNGTGAINVDGCRIAVDPSVDDMLRGVKRAPRTSQTWENGSGFKNEKNALTGVPVTGRWPANLIHDGSEEAMELFPQSSEQQSERSRLEQLEAALQVAMHIAGLPPEHFDKAATRLMRAIAVEVTARKAEVA